MGLGGYLKANSHGCVLGIGIICRRHLDNIRTDEIESVEATYNSAQLAG